MQSLMQGNKAGNGKEEYIADMEAFWSDVEEERVELPKPFVRVLAGMIQEACRVNTTKEGEEHEEQHVAFQATLEELREGNPAERAMILAERFDNLTAEERLVLTELANDRPVKVKANNLRMTPEEFMKARKSAEKKIKK